MSVILNFLVGLLSRILGLSPDTLLNPGFLLRKTLCAIYLYFSRRHNKNRFNNYDFNDKYDPFKSGVLAPKVEWDTELPAKSRSLRRSSDEIFFYGTRTSGERLLVRIIRYSKQTAHAWLYLRLADGRTYTLPDEVTLDLSDGNRFCTRGLRIQCLSPMRKWRIAFSGIMRPCHQNRGSSPDKPSKKEVYVQMNFIWSALTDVFDWTEDIPLLSVADYLASEVWLDVFANVKRYKYYLDGYEQGGYLMGSVSVEDEELEMHLNGMRMRSRTRKTLDLSPEIAHIFGYAKAGQMFHIMSLNAAERSPTLFYGHYVTASGFSDVITGCSVNGKSLSCTTMTAATEVSFKTDRGDEFHVNIGRAKSGGSWNCTLGWNGVYSMEHFDLTFNGIKGSGIRLTGNPSSTVITDIPVSVDRVLPVGKAPLPVPPVVTLQNSACKFQAISGGKGASLAVLAEIAVKEKPFQFTVPRGIVVTTAGYQKFLASQGLENFESLLSCIQGCDDISAKIFCERAVKRVEECSLPETVSTSLQQHLKSVFGKDFETLRFAVRSSASGEDSEDMSAAGQMATFLGVQGFQQVCNAVAKCWASQFSHIAVSYKRQYGQILNSPMAVVIQEMVPSDIAGVMFTCDPVSGNPSTICITANYGLGESVVSAAAEPDTVILSRDMSDSVKLVSTTLGKKKLRIVMNEKSSGVKKEQRKNSRESCIKEKDALKLGKVGVTLEKYFGAPRDVEWAICKGNVYLLQARPITSLDKETEFEIIHELDTPFQAEKEFITKANIGEVMNGAFSPLGISTIDGVISVAGKSMIPPKYWREENSPSSGYLSKIMPVSHSHHFIDMNEILKRFSPSQGDRSVNNAIMLSLFGRIIDDPEIEDSRREKFDRPPTVKTRHFLDILKAVFLTSYSLEMAKTLSRNSRIHFKRDSSAWDMYSVIMKNFYIGRKGLILHANSSRATSILNNIAMSILAKARGAMNEETYSDLAQLLSSCSDIVSAGIPGSLQKLADRIARDTNKDQFQKMNPQEAVLWLKSTRKPSGKFFKQFLREHGHRCVNEFDVHSVTWGMDPSQVIKNVQTMMKETTQQNSLAKKKTSLWESIRSLKIPLNMQQKLTLLAVANWCRKGVAVREDTKSYLIKMMDVYRQAFFELSKQLVCEGRLPDADLMFFLTYQEIGILLRTRDPRLLARAHHRRRIYPKLQELHFPEIVKCPPARPIISELPDITGDTMEMKGVPISKGSVKAAARVITKIEDAVMIQKGEILITYATDIGWSPYFPLLGGIVTELGGLMSHGAVIAREYGLPCIVGLHGATQVFKTGDFVLLDAGRGIIRKVDEKKS